MTILLSRVHGYIFMNYIIFFFFYEMSYSTIKFHSTALLYRQTNGDCILTLTYRTHYIRDCSNNNTTLIKTFLDSRNTKAVCFIFFHPMYALYKRK
jgi:hypothetical protein